MKDIKKAKSKWKTNGLADWVEGDTAYISCVFSWGLQSAYEKCIWYKQQGYKVRAGGPAVILNPAFLSGVALIGGEVDALPHHNPCATFTSRGCIRNCSFCAVPRIEGKLVELDDWKVKPIICDNNLLACSNAHFNRVIDRLLDVNGVDFNQGLDARLMTEHHAKRLGELHGAVIRIAFDNIRDEKRIIKAYDMLRINGVDGKDSIRVYALIGYTDTPEDALYRLQKIIDIGANPTPMRYQPLDSRRKNEYIGSYWTERELKDYMHYWSSMRIICSIPFSDYLGYRKNKDLPNQDIAQIEMGI